MNKFAYTNLSCGDNRGKKNRKFGHGGWRDGSAVKSTGCCSSRGPEFNSQKQHGGSQPYVMRSGALFWRSGVHAGRTLYTKRRRRKRRKWRRRRRRRKRKRTLGHSEAALVVLRAPSFLGIAPLLHLPSLGHRSQASLAVLGATVTDLRGHWGCGGTSEKKIESPETQQRLESYSISWELQMPREVPVAAGVLALLALLALVYHCLNEAWKSRWRLCCGGWRCPPTGKSLQFVFIHSPNEGQPGILPSEPSPVSPDTLGTSGLLFSFRYEEEPTFHAQSRL